MDLRITHVRGQVIRGQMGVAPHHAFRLPASELLQSKQRRPTLDMPARPGMAQVVKTKVFTGSRLGRSGRDLRCPERLAILPLIVG